MLLRKLIALRQALQNYFHRHDPTLVTHSLVSTYRLWLTRACSTCPSFPVGGWVAINLTFQGQVGYSFGDKTSKIYNCLVDSGCCCYDSAAINYHTQCGQRPRLLVIYYVHARVYKKTMPAIPSANNSNIYVQIFSAGLILIQSYNTYHYIRSTESHISESLAGLGVPKNVRLDSGDEYILHHFLRKTRWTLTHCARYLRNAETPPTRNYFVHAQ